MKALAKHSHIHTRLAKNLGSSFCISVVGGEIQTRDDEQLGSNPRQRLQGRGCGVVRTTFINIGPGLTAGIGES